MPKYNPLDDFLNEPASDVGSGSTTVPNLKPKVTGMPYRIAIVGEAPGRDEIEQGKPFVGYSGQLLDRFLSRFGILRDACFIGNICQHQPPGNKIATFDWDGPQIQGGLARLKEDIVGLQPNVTLLLGGSALHAFMAPNVVPKKRKTKDGWVFVFPNLISDWRGSFFTSHPNSPCPDTKCIAAYHPAACLRQYEWTPYLLYDIQRAYGDATFPDLRPPQRTLKVGLTYEETLQELDNVIAGGTAIGTDIEGYWNNWKCISFAPHRDYAFIVPLVHINGDSYWTVDQEVEILKRVVAILSSPNMTKVWQNGLYDRFVLQYGYNIVVRGPSHDIMLKHWELYSELEKALSVQNSIYGREPFYKTEVASNDEATFHRYCCKDSATTKENDEEQDRYLNAGSRQHYHFNLGLLNALLYMELRGIRYNKDLAKERLNEIQKQIYTLQHRLDQIAGTGLKTSDKVVLRALVRDTMCYKRDSSKVKVGYEQEYEWCMRVLFGEGPLQPHELGRLSTALGLELNVKGQQLKKYLYETLKLPVQHDPHTGSVTADYEALITLKRKSDHVSLPIIIDMTELRTRAQMLTIATDPDGRIRSSYNEVGSETGRVTSLTSPTGSGYNLQTIPDENELKKEDHPLHKGMRDLVISDSGHYLAKCDLKGADGWTVGANLAALGDTTMLDDLRFGLKPASVLCYAARHGPTSVVGKRREELKELCNEVKKEDWDYFAYKQCIWGFCYLMGIRKAVNHVFNVSEGTVLVDEHDMDLAKQVLFRRYNIQLWHRAMERRLFTQPYPPNLISPSGHKRLFFGRKADIVGQALAHEPQSVTTYATNQAVYKCWTDPENRIYLPQRVEVSKMPHDLDRGSSSMELAPGGKRLLEMRRDSKTVCKLRVEPLHQVHDEALFQFRIEDTAWATGKIKSWFNNPIRIAGIEVTIPFEGSYGTNWAMDSTSKVGSI